MITLHGAAQFNDDHVVSKVLLRFEELVAQAEGYVSIREGRAYWQMVLCGEVRTALLRIGQRLVDGGFTPRYDYAFETLSGIPYDRWRDYDAEDSIRFYALRMREAGMIKASPQKIIADGTDWRFLNELKRELKA